MIDAGMGGVQRGLALDPADSWDTMQCEWALETHERSRRLLTKGSFVLGASMLLGLCLDLMFIEEARLPVTIAMVLLCFTTSAMLSWLSWAKRNTLVVAAIGSMALTALGALHLGTLGGMDGPFFYVIYLLPGMTLSLPIGMRLRIIFSFCHVGTFIAVWAIVYPHHLQHPFAHVAWLHSGLTTIAFIYFGNIVYESARSGFILRTQIARREERLAEQNIDLVGEVEGQTRDLRAVSDRAAYVRQEERRHMAGVLHDDMGQLVVSARAQLHNLSRALESVEKQPEYLGLERIVRSMEQTTRNIVSNLRDDELPFEVALDDLVESYRVLERVDISLAIHCKGAEPPSDISEICLRVVQESLTNIIKHAGATHAGIEVALRKQCLEVVVVDNGRGLSDKSSDSSHGLQAMRERVEAAKGSLRVERVPGAGTEVAVSLPWPGQGQAAL
ncbi:MAG: hypothetical protein JKY56_09350 [Kofleriaceae bacterium]|nr:hypothetical protein [Kofleriaceae bacterium]